MKQKSTVISSTPIQLKLPVDLERIIKISDPVYTFNEAVSHIDLNQYFAPKERKTGRPEYDRETLFKLVLFAFMEFGYCSVRQLRKLCDIQMAVCDEYIAQYAAYPYASDMDRFHPLLEAFHSRYGFYPQYPVADASYGSFNNYLFCQELTGFRAEVLNNLNSIHGAYLRMNRYFS